MLPPHQLFDVAASSAAVFLTTRHTRYFVELVRVLSSVLTSTGVTKYSDIQKQSCTPHSEKITCIEA